MSHPTRWLWPLLCLALLLPSCAGPQLMVADDLDRLALAPAGERRAYGTDELQYGELTLPDGPGPHPVVVFAHGGCWLAKYDLPHTRALAGALAADGFAVWNLEYRRVGDEGGGWPGTFLDVAAGADHLRRLAGENDLDLERVVAMGHSAGGHLALWLAARSRVEEGSELYDDDPLPLAGVIALAPAPQLAELHEREVCGHVIDKLMGGSPAQFPERYRNGSPSELAPSGVPATVIVGKHDSGWKPVGLSYVGAARAAGDTRIKLIEARRSAHFEVINPETKSFDLVRQSLREMLAQP